MRRAFCAAGLLSPGWMARAELRTALIKVRPMFAHSGPFGLYRPISDHILRRAILALHHDKLAVQVNRTSVVVAGGVAAGPTL
jgi:hypothetical protein